ncbi:FRG domain-containing protein [Candidatus Synechococcus calcipolaris G9]|uniref:FRG domain-containing protein n=1 Tax=Candidatus Synechococcus calcipolaris G9 TaxID=1497997 RepID=A0ABT6F1T1_9SYNE|nr:FRG domain-containing protein [Candidatus Synechococcus calcipolaris]MDG2991818.1 FRG domain-containing protein [Candidatus Synechococcus calcipolaris G9]
MTERFYLFEDEKKEKIVSSFSNPQPGKEDRIECLSEDDPRVQEYLGPEWARAKFQAWKINSLDDLIAIFPYLRNNPKYGFRGQSNYNWSLATVLERNKNKIFQQYGFLHEYEHRVLIEAQRRSHLYFDNNPDNQDSLSWLSLLRHLGVPTRLLDISWSIFIATYFAVSSNPDNDGCIWFFNQYEMGGELRNNLSKNENVLFYKDHNIGTFVDFYQPPTIDPKKIPIKIEGKITYSDIIANGININLLFNLALLGVLSVKGVIFVEPYWMNKRMEMQQGAFLVPLNIRNSFEENLGSLCSIDSIQKEIEIQDIRHDSALIGKMCSNAWVAKIRIPKDIKGELKTFLDSTNVRRLVLFPDVDGLSGYLNDLVPSSN